MVLSKCGLRIIDPLRAHSLYRQTTGTAQSGAATRQGNTNAEGSATQSSDQVKPALRAGGQRRDASERGGGYYPGDSDPWFFRDDLREELELDDDQIERLREVYDETRSGADARGTGEELRDQARAERMRELRNRFDDTFSERASSIFRMITSGDVSTSWACSIAVTALLMTLGCSVN